MRFPSTCQAVIQPTFHSILLKELYAQATEFNLESACRYAESIDYSRLQISLQHVAVNKEEIQLNLWISFHEQVKIACCESDSLIPNGAAMSITINRLTYDALSFIHSSI